MLFKNSFCLSVYEKSIDVLAKIEPFLTLYMRRKEKKIDKTFPVTLEVVWKPNQTEVKHFFSLFINKRPTEKRSNRILISTCPFVNPLFASFSNRRFFLK